MPSGSASSSTGFHSIQVNIHLPAAAAQPAAPDAQPTAAAEPQKEPAASEQLGPSKGEAAWVRLIVHLRRIRRLQRIWHLLGQFLQVTGTKSLRDRIRKL